jgi:hypothetical protein
MRKPLDPQLVMSAYNEHERIGITITGCKKIVTPDLVRFASEDNYGSFISYYDLSSENLESVIEAEIEYFSERGQTFEWKTYDADQPPDIGDALVAHGFIRGEAESFMALDLELIEQPLPDNGLCVEVTDINGIRDAIAVQEQVWGEDRSGQFAHLLSGLQSTPEDLTIYVVYEDGIPVSSARIVYNGDSPFAGIWGGSTVAEYRDKGYYSALLHKRINDAKLRGKRYLIIDASEMSRPIVARHGFQFIANTVPYTFQSG